MYTNPPLAISTWSLHRTLGLTYPSTPEHDVATPEAQPTYGYGALTLLDVPAKIAALGIGRLEICSFHLPTRDPIYLSELRAALNVSHVMLQSLLIEYGDITHPEHGARDLAWIARWIETAGQLGAEQVRVIAGKQQPTDAALRRSIEGLRTLARVGEDNGVRVVTENWFDLMAGPEQVHFVLDSLEGAVGLNGDFGNWDARPDKYAALASILPRAVTCHAKVRFPEARIMDEADIRQCLEASVQVGFFGPFTLIYDGPGEDEIEHLILERDYFRAFDLTPRSPSLVARTSR